MNKLIKASLVAAAFLFVAGCSTQTKPSAHQDTVANAHSQVKKGVRSAQKVDKLDNTYTGDSTK